MATYSGTIDLRVTGNALKETDLINKRINEIRALTKSLKPAPNLFDKRGNARIIKAKEELKKLVNEYGKGVGAGKRFSNTLAGLNSQISAFGRIIGNVNTNSDEFVSAITAQEKASRRLAKAEASRLRVQTQVNTANTVGRATSVQETLDLGKVVPKSIAGLELYQRELQETFRNVEIGTESYKELRDEILRVNALMRDFEMTAPIQSSPIGGRVDIPGSPAAIRAERQQRQRQRGTKARDIATGFGFPLLFGGGPVQALAGGIGGALGGLGGSIAGSAIASQIEGLVGQIADLGNALNPLAFDLEAVTTAAGFAETETAQLLQKIKQYGSATEAARLATALLETKIGKGGVKALQDFGKSATDLGNALSTIFTQVLANIAKVAGPLLESLARFAGEQADVGAFLERTGLTGQEKLAQEILGTSFQRSKGVLTTESSRALSGFSGRSRALGGEGFQTAEQARAFATGIATSSQRKLDVPVLQEIESIAAGVQTPEDEKAQSEAIRIGQLGEKAALQERLLVLDQRIADAVLKEDEGLKAILEKEKIKETLATKISNIKQSDASKGLQAVQIRLAEGEAAQKIQDIDIKTDQINANKTKKAKETLDGLLAEQNLLQATLDGKEDEVRLEQRIKDILEQNTKLTDDEVRGILEGSAALKEKIRLQEQSKALYERITKTIEDGLVDGIMAAVEGTKSLSESLSGVLKQLARMFLSQGIGSFGKDGKGGSGLLGLLPFADGGRPPVGRPSIVGERGPELFVPRSSGTIIPNHALGGSATVNVAVDASGSSVEGNADQAAQLGKVIGVAVQQELIKQKRPGGLLAS